MIASWWRRAGPWATPVLVAVEVVLVWSGVLSLGTAVGVAVAVEALLWVTAISRAVVATRRFRAQRASGADGWAAAEDGLAAMIPRRAAHVLLIEPRLWVCLARWVIGRHDGKRSVAAFRYDQALRPVLWAVIGLVVIEGAAVELVLALAVHQKGWLFVSMAVHAYAVFGLLGMLAGFATRPHLIQDDQVRIRDGVFSEVLVPIAAVRGVRKVNRSSFGRSGLKITEDGHSALLAHGDATIEIILDPAQPVTFVPAPQVKDRPIDTLTITADNPADFAKQLSTHRRNASLPTMP